MDKSRREILANLLYFASASLPYSSSSYASTSINAVSDVEDDIRALMAEEADGAFDPNSPRVKRTLTDSEWQPFQTKSGDWNWWEFEREDKPFPSWAPYASSADYQPFEQFDKPSSAFEVGHEQLEWIAERNSFDLGNDGKVVLGLRGSILANRQSDSDWVKKASLELAVPDHKNYRCLMGVWDRKKKLVRFFTASTVPEVNYMWQQMRMKRGANLMPTGLYHYKVGTHSVGSKKHPQVGALRLVGYKFENSNLVSNSIYVLRTLNDLTFSISDETELWDICQPNDNIHAAIFGEDWSNYLGSSKSKDSGERSLFSSAGCQVIPGGYQLDKNRKYTTEPIGLWRDFRVALGLKEIPEVVAYRETSDDNKEFYYMLITGFELALTADGSSDFRKNYRPLRVGSSGGRVKDMQEAIEIEADGHFGARTADALIWRKKYIEEKPETPIYLS